MNGTPVAPAVSTPDPMMATLARWCDRARSWPLPGSGATARRFELLASIAHSDLVLGRLVEAHADAASITAELGGAEVRPGERWGVWAAGPPDSLRALHSERGWTIAGVKAWCSGGTLVTHALVDASATDGSRLFAVDLADPGITACPSAWVGQGMIRTDTRSMAFDQAEAVPVGHPGQYLSRPGFWAGAVGVAACWHGGTVAVARTLLHHARTSSDPHLLAHLGAVHVGLYQNRVALSHAAEELDRRPTDDHALTAISVRATVERNASRTIDRVGRALGPAPLAHDASHAALVADLSVYVRQHHAEKDLERVGRAVALADDDPWQL